MPNRIEARSAKAALTNATGRLPLLRLFSTLLIDVLRKASIDGSRVYHGIWPTAKWGEDL